MRRRFEYAHTAVVPTRYVMYIFDHGALIGFRHAMTHPEQTAGIVSQNGNAYEEGPGDARQPNGQYWNEPASERAAPLRSLLSLEKVRERDLDGLPTSSAVETDVHAIAFSILEVVPGFFG